MFLSSNTRHCTPLECRREEESCSIDISQDLLSHSLFVRLILLLSKIELVSSTIMVSNTAYAVPTVAIRRWDLYGRTKAITI